MLFADGYVTQRNPCIGLALKSDDMPHVEKFRDDLASNYNIKTYTSKTPYGMATYSRLLITSEKMKEDLIKQGVIPQKSLTLVFPHIDPSLVHHFVRGYFDGDGSFSKCKSGYRVSVCGTAEFLEELGINIGFPNHKLSKRHKTRNVNNFTLEIGGRLQVLKIGDYMYNNATVFLERKHNRYIELKNKYL
jgi:hypothetical protein